MQNQEKSSTPEVVEIWKQIPDTINRYASNMGRTLRFRSDEIDRWFAKFATTQWSV